MARSQHPIAPSHADQPGPSAGHLVLYHCRNAAQGDNPENIPLPLFVRQPQREFILPQPKRTSDLLSLTILLSISQLPARLHCLRGLPPTPPPTSSQPPTPRFPQRQHFPAATLIRTRQHQAHPQLEHAPESQVSKTTQPRSQEKFGPSSDSSTRLADKCHPYSANTRQSLSASDATASTLLA